MSDEVPPTISLAQYITEMLNRHPGVSMRQFSLQAGLNENAVQQILKATHFVPKPQTIQALTDTWGTPEDYITLMKLAGHTIPATLTVDELSQAKQRAINLLALPDIPNELVFFVIAGLEDHLNRQKTKDIQD